MEKCVLKFQYIMDDDFVLFILLPRSGSWQVCQRNEHWNESTVYVSIKLLASLISYEI